ncbi:MAG: peptidylprolyl isomerase [Candidatus Pacearchaeota archaeon]
MLIKKGDFIELEFTASTEAGIFDTTNPEIAKTLGYKRDVKPLKIIVGEHMVIEGLDKQLEGKEINKEYTITIEPKDGFGERKTELIKTVPLNAFEKKPIEGEGLLINGILARVIKVASGRVTLDFNHPLAGKKVFYKFKILRLINDKDERAKTILDYFKTDYKMEEKNDELIIKLKLKIPQIEELIKKYIEKVRVIYTESDNKK